MNTVTMTLTEFLLARIAFDEKFYRRRALAGFHPRDLPLVLAELRSRKRVVGIHGGKDGGSCGDCGAQLPCPSLRAVAFAYADHPDYRAEWRP